MSVLKIWKLKILLDTSKIGEKLFHEAEKCRVFACRYATVGLLNAKERKIDRF